MASDWISASEAYSLVHAHIPMRASEAIFDRAADGMVATRAEKFILNNKVIEPATVPESFWRNGRSGYPSAKWASGDFSQKIDGRYDCRAYGVRFLRAHLEKMLPSKGRGEFANPLPGNYAPAARCRAEIEATLDCSRAEAERMIIRRAKTGLLPSRCTHMAVRTKDRYGTSDEDQSTVAIPDWFWEDCLDHPDTVLDWVSGVFVGRGEVDDSECKVRLRGVEFEVSGIVALEDYERDQADQADDVDDQEIPGVEGQSGLEGVPRGPKLSERWRAWVAELTDHLHSEGFPDGVGSQGQEELINAVDVRLAKAGKEGLARATVQPVVQAVLDRHRDP